MGCLSQFSIHQGEDGYGNHRDADDDLQTPHRHSKQKQCAEARSNERKNDRGRQMPAAQDAPSHKRQGTTHAHERQSQHVGCNCHVSFYAQPNHHRNGDEGSTAGYDAEHAREEEYGD